MANKKKKKSFPSWAKTLIVLVLVLAILGGAGYAIYYFFGDDIKNLIRPQDTPKSSLTVTVNGVAYTEDADGLTFADGMEIGVSGAEEYSVQIVKNTATDFTFTVGTAPYKWSAFDTFDFSPGFGAAFTEDGFILTVPSLADIIRRAAETQESVSVETPPDGDIFTLIVTAKGEKNGIRLGFGLSPLHIEVSPPNFIV